MRTPTLLSILALNADAYGMAIAGESKQELSDGNEGARAEQKIEVGGREKSTREGTEVAPQDIVLCVDFDYEVFECEEDEDDDEEEDSYEIGDYMSEGDEENMMLEEDWKSLQGPQKLLKAHLEKKESFSDDKEFKDMCDIDLGIIKQIIKFGEKRALITFLEKAKQGWAEESSKLDKLYDLMCNPKPKLVDAELQKKILKVLQMVVEHEAKEAFKAFTHLWYLQGASYAKSTAEMVEQLRAWSDFVSLKGPSEN